MGSSELLEKTITSSRYTKHVFHRNPARRISSVLWKIAGALQSPKGMRLNWYVPECDVNAVFRRSPGSTGISVLYRKPDGSQRRILMTRRISVQARRATPILTYWVQLLPEQSSRQCFSRLFGEIVPQPDKVGNTGRAPGVRSIRCCALVNTLHGEGVRVFCYMRCLLWHRGCNVLLIGSGYSPSKVVSQICS
eukprot:IDg2062t1